MSRRGTDTVLAREMKAETADEAYKRLRKEIDAQMKRLHRALAKHDRDQARNPENWGYPGDYGEVKKQMGELLGFIE